LLNNVRNNKLKAKYVLVSATQSYSIVVGTSRDLSLHNYVL